jgi:hypothetical protein
MHTWNSSYLGDRGKRLASPGKSSVRPCLKNKRMGAWLKWQSACLAGAKPWIQPLVHVWGFEEEVIKF